MVAIAPGIFLAQSVVPSSGSTAISTFGPCCVPTFSPMNSIGASSRSPSPITTVPSIGSLFSLAPHGIDGGLVGVLLIAATAQARGGDGGALGHAGDFERQKRGPGCFSAGVLVDIESPLPTCSTQFFSIRMTCGVPAMTPLRLIAFSARRTASSEVA